MTLRRLTCLFFLVALLAAASGTSPGQTPPSQSNEDVVRVKTELVQTDVMVFDKQGNFIDGLKRDQFQLRVDGKPRELQFFDRVSAGSRNEDAQLAAARGNTSSTAGGSQRPVPLDRGRTVYFFIDDLHLSIRSIGGVRKMLTHFIDHEMGQNDEAAIVSASGQIGFLQQLSNDKTVLRAALGRLKTRPYDVRDMEFPRMSEYQAMLIQRNDDDVLNYFVDAMIKEDPLLPRGQAADQVRARAAQIVNQGQSFTINTLLTLKGVVDRSKALEGRKILFLISDGFLLDTRNSDSFDRMRRVTSAAAASGMVIYSIDALGLDTDAPDVSTETAIDPSGRLQRAAGGERGASEDSLSAIASDTGGRAFFNNNVLSTAVIAALKESSAYYLIAWRPEGDEPHNTKNRRIEVTIPGHSNWIVRTRSAAAADELAESSAKKAKTPATPVKPFDELRAALRSPYPKRDLEVALSLNFVNLPAQGSILASSLRVPTSDVIFDTTATTPAANIDLAGLVLDQNGKLVDSFSQRVTLKQSVPGAKPPPGILFNHFSRLPPGLYQVRVAANEVKQRRAGSIWRWIQIPDLNSKSLTLSSLIVGEHKNPDRETNDGPSKPATSPLGQVTLNVDHIFPASSRLRFLTFVYNAVSGSLSSAPRPSINLPASSADAISAGPDLAVQVQVFRDNEPVITDPLHKINVEGVTDLMRIPFAAELDLGGLQSGSYALQVTVIDRLAKTSASQRFNFQVD